MFLWCLCAVISVIWSLMSAHGRNGLWSLSFLCSGHEGSLQGSANSVLEQYFFGDPDAAIDLVSVAEAPKCPKPLNSLTLSNSTLKH